MPGPNNNDCQHRGHYLAETRTLPYGGTARLIICCDCGEPRAVRRGQHTMGGNYLIPIDVAALPIDGKAHDLAVV